MSSRHRAIPWAKMVWVFLAILTAGGIAYYGMGPSSHSDRSEMSAAVINWQKLWNQLPAMVKIRQELNAQLQSYHQEFSLYEQTLRAKQNDLTLLQKKTNLKNPTQVTELEKARKEFAQAVNDTQKKAEMYQKKVNEDYQASLKDLQERVRQEMNQIVNERRIRLVLNSQYISHFDPALDITMLIVDRLKDYRPSTNVPEKAEGTALRNEASQ